MMIPRSPIGLVFAITACFLVAVVICYLILGLGAQFMTLTLVQIVLAFALIFLVYRRVL